MKFRNLIAMLLAVLLLSGCSMAAAENKLDAAGEKIENRLDAAEDAVESMAQPTAPVQTTPPATTVPGALTAAEAKAIALADAQLTAEQVTRLHTEYDVDLGVPEYDVEFHHDGWEYDYEIHAETGQILSKTKELDD